MGPIRDLISRIRERRMERMGSRQGLFPRLRNLINPLDSQSMMDRAQGTKVGTASPAPLSYNKRLFPSLAGGTATAAPKVAGKPAPSNPAQEDLASLTPPGIDDLHSQYADAQKREAIARARADVPGQPPERRAEFIAEAQSHARRAQQISGQFGTLDLLRQERADKKKPALTSQFESQQDVERRMFSGETTPAEGAMVIFTGLQAGRQTPLTGQAADAERLEIQRRLTMTYLDGQMSNGQVPTTGTPLGAQLEVALSGLPAEQRQPYVTASLGPELTKSFISRVQASHAASQNPRPLDMAAVMQAASSHSQAELAKISPSFYDDAQSGNMIKFFGDAAKGAGQFLPDGGDIGRGATSLVNQIFDRPAASGASPVGAAPATPMAPPVAAPAPPSDVFTEGPFKGRKRPKPITVK